MFSLSGIVCGSTVLTTTIGSLCTSSFGPLDTDTRGKYTSSPRVTQSRDHAQVCSCRTLLPSWKLCVVVNSQCRHCSHVFDLCNIPLGFCVWFSKTRVAHRVFFQIRFVESIMVVGLGGLKISAVLPTMNHIKTHIHTVWFIAFWLHDLRFSRSGIKLYSRLLFFQLVDAVSSLTVSEF